MRRSISHFATRLLHKLVPHHCPICDAIIAEQGLCPACWANLSFISEPICQRCGRPHRLSIADGDMLCALCLRDESPLRYRRAVLHYDDASKALILPFKHASRVDLAPLMAQMMAPQCRTLLRRNTNDEKQTKVIPIPLHITRRAYRRYNQSAELAREICTLLNCRSQLDVTSLYRKRATSSLARHNKAKRDKILRHAFAIRDRNSLSLAGCPILLIDDVMTTGRTAHHAALCLAAHGAGPIDCLTFARVQ